jgi:hypothetical protein
VIFGSAGPELRTENAIKTAQLINKTRPYLIFTGTIHAESGCPLYDQMCSGQFQENTLGQYLEEEEAFVRTLDTWDCMYFGVHPSNVTGLYGNLAQQKDEMLTQIHQLRNQMTQAQLNSVPQRRGEGAIVL